MGEFVLPHRRYLVKPTEYCACGCGGRTRTGHRFVGSGHDSNLRRRINLVLEVRARFADCPEAVQLLEASLPAVAYERLGRCPVCELPDVTAHGKPRHEGKDYRWETLCRVAGA